jgi:carbon monoxide dehydrogenase subunit G
MELVHDFVVPVPADQAFDLLVDVGKIGPCLPGAVITSVEGDSFEGGMKIKLGPISMTFRGNGELVERDPRARRAVIHARGRDAKGNGGAQATVTASLQEHGDQTAVHVVTDLNVTGKAAQFGGGVMRDVSNRMLGQFADNLAELIRTGAAAGGPAGFASAAASNGTAVPAPSSGTAAGTSAPAGTSAVRPTAAFAPANDAGIDAIGLLLGSDAVKNTLRPAAAAFIGLLVGYLYGKNRVLERTMRRD